MELLDIVDRNGNPTGETVPRTKAHREGIMHRTSHVWLLRQKNGRVEILLQKRSENKDSNPGCFDISSAGHIPAGCGFKASAIRELQEELGISAAEDELILCGNRLISADSIFHGAPFHDRQYSRVFCLWRDVEASECTLQAEEVSCVQWMDLDECIRAVRDNTFPHCISLDELALVAAAAGK